MKRRDIRRIVKVKSRRQYEALKRLDSFLNANNPRLVRFMVRFWQDQQAAISYQELRESYLAGNMTSAQFDQWRQDYAVFFNKYLKDELINAASLGGASTATATAATMSDAWSYRPMSIGIDRWITTHGAEWVTIMSDEGKEAISAMIKYCTDGNITIDEFSIIIRPTIGLNAPQAAANLNFYNNQKARIKEDLLNKHPKMKETTAEKQAEKKAKDMAARYAARQHRYRAQMIAETELAFAYNKGADDAIGQLMDQGLLPQMKKVWSTAADELVCEICGALEGETVGYGDSYDFKGRTLYEGSKETPPAHPKCRCAICYEEV